MTEQEFNDNLALTSTEEDDLLYFAEYGDNFQKEAILRNQNSTLAVLRVLLENTELLPVGEQQLRNHKNFSEELLLIAA